MKCGNCEQGRPSLEAVRCAWCWCLEDRLEKWSENKPEDSPLEYTPVQQDMKMKKFRKCVRFSDFEVVESMRHQSQQQTQQNSGLEEAALSMRKDAMQQGEEEHEDEIDEAHKSRGRGSLCLGSLGK